MKDQYKTFKDQINVINKNRKDTFKTEDGRITDMMKSRYFDKEYKDLINNLSVYGLRDFISQIFLIISP